MSNSRLSFWLLAETNAPAGNLGRPPANTKSTNWFFTTLIIAFHALAAHLCHLFSCDSFPDRPPLHRICFSGPTYIVFLRQRRPLNGAHMKVLVAGVVMCFWLPDYLCRFRYLRHIEMRKSLQPHEFIIITTSPFHYTFDSNINPLMNSNGKPLNVLPKFTSVPFWPSGSAHWRPKYIYTSVSNGPCLKAISNH